MYEHLLVHAKFLISAHYLAKLLLSINYQDFRLMT